MFDAPLPEFEAPESPRRGSRPGKRYGSSAANAVIAVAGGLAVSALVFVGASAMLNKPSTTTVPATTNTTVAPVSPTVTPPVVKTPTRVVTGGEEGTRTTPTTVPTQSPTPTTAPNTFPSDDNGGPFSGEGEGGGDR